MALLGKNKGQVSKKSYPPNHLKRFIHRNPEIPDDSESEYGSDNEDSVPASQDSGIGSQESIPENSSPVPSDAMTVLSGADPGLDRGGPQIMTGLNCQQCTAASCKRSKPFSAWGPGPALGPQKLLGISLLNMHSLHLGLPFYTIFEIKD